MPSITQRLQKWFSQPQDIVGLAGFIGTTAGSVAQYVTTHSVSLPVLIGGIAASLIAITVPNGAAFSSDAAKLIEDALAAGLTKNVAAVPSVIADGEKLAGDLTQTKGA